MSNVKATPEQGTRVETLSPVELLDCGQASKVTKGVPYLVFYEGGTPPFDTVLI